MSPPPSLTEPSMVQGWALGRGCLGGVWAAARPARTSTIPSTRPAGDRMYVLDFMRLLSATGFPSRRNRVARVPSGRRRGAERAMWMLPASHLFISHWSVPREARVHPALRLEPADPPPGGRPDAAEACGRQPRILSRPATGSPAGNNHPEGRARARSRFQRELPRHDWMIFRAIGRPIPVPPCVDLVVKNRSKILSRVIRAGSRGRCPAPPRRPSAGHAGADPDEPPVLDGVQGVGENREEHLHQVALPDADARKCRREILAPPARCAAGPAGCTISITGPAPRPG